MKSTEQFDFQPINELKAFYQVQGRKYAFAAKTKAEAVKWQASLREELKETVGFLDTPSVEPDPVIVFEVDRGELLMRKVVIKTAASVQMPLYILIPKGVTKPMPTVLAYHGHGPGVCSIVGINPDGSLNELAADNHYSFAISLCRLGLCVVAPEIAGFGERTQTVHNIRAGSKPPKTCHEMATWAMMLGKSALGIRLRDSIRLLDWVRDLDYVDSENIGVMGFSGGGMLAFFHSCLDTRIKATVVGGYFSGFEENLLPISHCICNHVPNLLNLGDHQDLVGLILPRPVFFESGKEDPIFQIEIVKKSVANARKICQVLGEDPEKIVGFDQTELGHQISGQHSFAFLKKQLISVRG